MNQIDIAKVDAIVQRMGRSEDSLIPLLQAVQAAFNYLPEPALRRLAEITDCTPAAIVGVSTFYSQFRHKPAGRHFVKVCIGTACHVKGAENVYQAFLRKLAIPEGEDTDAARLFTVEKVACLGCCMLAPAVQIDDITYGFVDPPKVGSVLQEFLEAQKAAAYTRELIDEGRDMAGEVRICQCSSCRAGGTGDVYEALVKEVVSLRLPVRVTSVGCTGVSYQTPLLAIVLSSGAVIHYGRVEPLMVRGILLRHFRPARVLKRVALMINSLLEKTFTDEAWTPVTRYAIDLRHGVDGSYTGPQVNVATELCGKIDPLNLDAYRAEGGFAALEKALHGMTPEAVVHEIHDSGLRGRGGGGYPTGLKWRLVHDRKTFPHYIICNGDEGDPGAFMDRMILESFPFRVLEGMIIASYAVGASVGYLYIRAEYPLAAGRIGQAIALCEKAGLLGANILGSQHSLRLKVIEGAGAFVCGEETALIAAIEGKRGMPRFRPPFPAESGVYGKPTLINNVETFAVVGWIIRHGSEAFAAMGTEDSRGTKAFALAGKVVRGGLVEVPMGISLRDVVDKIGGGIAGDRALKAIQVGGPSGGCIPERLADISVGYAELARAGSMMGSGGLVVLDDSDCMVDIARYFLAFTQAESCGKCTFCRLGTRRMLDILERLCDGNAHKGDLELLIMLGARVKDGSLCALGRTAPNPVLSTIEHFRDEYEAHVQGRCPAKKCKALIRYTVTPSCIGCTLCAQGCPVDAICGRAFAEHKIDSAVCTCCDACRVLCPAGAIEIHDRFPPTAGVEIADA